MKKGILATKVGMTQIFNEDGVLTPVTVLLAGPCVVTQVKTCLLYTSPLNSLSLHNPSNRLQSTCHLSLTFLYLPYNALYDSMIILDKGKSVKGTEF